MERKKLPTSWQTDYLKRQESIDLSDVNEDFSKFSLTEEDMTIIAVPSYNGRVPSTAANRIAKIKGNGAKTILVCVYGNRAYEDTLVELQDIAEQAGFKIVAAIAEHSIAHRYTANRPDKDDYDRLKAFAVKIVEKLIRNDFSTPTIPGNRPYHKVAGAAIVPKATKACTKCDLCASKCPVGAIDKNNPTKVDKEVCISCMRCVTACPHQARKVNGLLLGIVNMMLKKECTIRKECELYL